MKISKKELLKALETIKPGLSITEDTIEQSTSFAFIEDHIVTYNDSISISYPFKSNIKGAVSAKELYTLLNKLSSKKDILNLEIKDNELRINAGKEGKAGIKIEKDVLLPLNEIKTDNKWDKIPKKLIEGLKFCSFSTAKDNSKPLLTCIHVKDKIIESTDNFRATRFYLDKKVKEFLIPANSIKFLEKFPAIKYNVTKSWVNFKSKEGALFSCRIFNQEFPDFSNILEVKGKKIKFPDIIEEAIDKAAIFCEKGETVSSPMIEIKMKKDTIIIKGEGDIGWFKKIIKTKYQGSYFTFKIASDFFVTMLKINNECILDKESKRVKFSSENWEHIFLLLMED